MYQIHHLAFPIIYFKFKKKNLIINKKFKNFKKFKSELKYKKPILQKEFKNPSLEKTGLYNYFYQQQNISVSSLTIALNG